MRGSLLSLKIRAFWALSLAAGLLLARSCGLLSYWRNHPGSLSPATLLQLAGHAADAGFALFLLLGCAAWGELILAKLPALSKGYFDRLERGVAACVLGQALLSFVLLAAGLGGGFTAPVFGALFIFLIWGCWRGQKSAPPVVQVLWDRLKEPLPPPLFAAVFLIGAGMLRAAVSTGAPPTDWDSLAYHLALPKIFLGRGEIFHVPWALNSHYPLSAELIYGMALALRGDLAAHWINFFNGALFLAAVFALGRRIYGSSAALWTVAILQLQPVFQRVIGNASTDFAVALPCLLAFSIFLQKRCFQEEEKPKVLFWAGSLAGMAASVKIVGLWAVAALLALEALEQARRALHGEKANFRGISGFMAGAAAFGAPWYLLNWAWTGSPVWPHFADLLGGTAWEVAVWRRIHSAVTEGIEPTFIHMLAVPFQLVLHPERFLYDPHYLIAPFLLLLAVRRARGRWTPEEAGMLWVLGVFMACWFWVNQAWRYALSAAGLIAILSAGWAAELARSKMPWKVFAALPIVALAPLAKLNINNESFAFFAVRSRDFPQWTPRERYIFAVLGPPYQMTLAANQILPPDAKALFFRDTRGYYLDREYAWGDPLNPGVVDYAAVPDAEALHQALLRLGFTHVLFNPYIGRYKGDAFQVYYARAETLMADMLQRHARSLWRQEGSGIYVLDGGECAIKRRKEFPEGRDGLLLKGAEGAAGCRCR